MSQKLREELTQIAEGLLQAQHICQTIQADEQYSQDIRTLATIINHQTFIQEERVVLLTGRMDVLDSNRALADTMKRTLQQRLVSLARAQQRKEEYNAAAVWTQENPNPEDHQNPRHSQIHIGRRNTSTLSHNKFKKILNEAKRISRGDFEPPVTAGLRFIFKETPSETPEGKWIILCKLLRLQLNNAILYQPYTLSRVTN